MANFKENSKLYFTKEHYSIIQEIREGEKCPYKYYVLIQTPFGVCKVKKQMWELGKVPTIQTALNKQEFLQNQIDIVHGVSKFKFLEPFEYTGSKSIYKIQCLSCNSTLLKTASQILNFGCPHCYLTKQKIKAKENRKSPEEFEKKFYLIHPDKKLLSVYVRRVDKVLIECENKHQYWQKADVTLRGFGCPRCALEKKGWNKTNFKNACENNKGYGIFYILKCSNENEEFYKLGITSRSVKERYRYKDFKLMPYNYEILQEITGDPISIWSYEKFLMKYITIKDLKYKPLIKFGGSSSECFKFK